MTETKAELRARMRSQRKALRAALPGAPAEAAAHVHALLGSLTFQPKTAAFYQAMGAEFDPTPVARALLKHGLKLALPRVAERDRPLVFHAFAPGDRLAADAHGCSAPLAEAAVVEPELLIVPLLAFDPWGGRLGQGGGYYDRTLEVLAKRALRPAFVGLAYAGQEVDRVPGEAHDQKLDGVLTERGYMPARKVS